MSKRRRKVNKLTDLEIDEVSLVDRGANQHAEFVISKRDEDAEDDDEFEKNSPDPSDLSTGEEDEDEDKYEENKKKKGFFKSLVGEMFGESTTDHDADGNIADMDDIEKAGLMPGQQLPYGQQPMGQPAPGPQNAMPPGPQAFPSAQQPGQMPGQQMPQQMPQQQMPGQMQAGPPLPDEVVQYIQQLEQQLAMSQGEGGQPSQTKQEDDVNPFGKSVDYDDDYEFLQELSKNLEDEETRETVNKALEAVEKANTRAEEAERIAKAERDHRVTQEFIAKARAYTGLPLSADEFGPVLKKLSETLEEEEYDLLTKALNAASESVANGILGEVGKRGTISDFEAISKAEGVAAEISKSEGISKEAALARVFDEHPEMYDEFLQEQGR